MNDTIEHKMLWIWDFETWYQSYKDNEQYLHPLRFQLTCFMAKGTQNTPTQVHAAFCSPHPNCVDILSRIRGNMTEGVYSIHHLRLGHVLLSHAFQHQGTKKMY